MSSVCPYCRQPIELLTGGWVCVTCWRRWPLVAVKWPEDAHREAEERIAAQMIAEEDDR